MDADEGPCVEVVAVLVRIANACRPLGGVCRSHGRGHVAVGVVEEDAAGLETERHVWVVEKRSIASSARGISLL